MRNEGVDIGTGQSMPLQQFQAQLGHLAGGVLEYGFAVLFDVMRSLVDRIVRGGISAAAWRHGESGTARTVNLMNEVDQCALAVCCRLKHDRSATVAEDDAGRAVCVVDYGGHHFSAYYQHIRVSAGGNKLRTDLQCVEKS